MRPASGRWCVLGLGAILVVAAVVRVYGLGLKPLWLDEAMTALVVMGRGPDDVPRGVALPLTEITSIFALPDSASWRDVVALLLDPRVQHTHPPLFYVVAHAWLTWWRPSLDALAWALRVLAAGFGVVAVGLVFGLARAAFGERVALAAAALMAVSPAMVMVAQEARNYTLPLALLAGALWVMVGLVNRVANQAPTRAVSWTGWALLNTAACYAHYYGVVAFAVQAATLIVFAVRARAWRETGRLVASVAAVGLAFGPWVATLLAHVRSPEQHWMRLRHDCRLVYDTLSAWQGTLVGMPWVGVSGAVAITTQVFPLVFGAWVLVVVFGELGRRLRAAAPPPGAQALLLTMLGVLGGLLVASFALGKHLLSEPRYHFVYYPAMVALLAWIVVGLPERMPNSWRARLVRPSRWMVLAPLLLVGLVNSLAVDLGLEYPKGFQPDRVGGALATATAPPVLVVQGSGSFHETVIGLTYLIELSRTSPAVGQTRFAFVVRGERYAVPGQRIDPAIFWEGFEGLRAPGAPPATLWVDGIRLEPWDYPRRLDLSWDGPGRVRCVLAPQELTRAASGDPGDRRWRPPFRLYHCAPVAPSTSS